MTRRYLFSLIFLLLNAYTNVSLNAQTKYYVSSLTGSDANTGMSWGTAFQSVAFALHSAKASSDTEVDIWVAQGSYGAADGYFGYSGDWTDTTFTFYRGNGVGRALKIYGGFAGTETTISERDGLHRSYLSASGPVGIDVPTTHVIVISGLSPAADSVVIDGFTIENARTLDTGYLVYNGVHISNAYGGGLNLTNDSNSNIAIRNCIFYYNRVNCIAGKVYGGGISVVDASLYMYNCTLHNNYATGSYMTWGTILSGNSYGGGLYASRSTLNIEKCNFDTNSSTAGSDFVYGTSYMGLGGGVYLSKSVCFFDLCNFVSNIACGIHGDSYGGGIGIDSCAPVFTNCSFISNSSKNSLHNNSFGAAVSCQNRSAPVFTNCMFSGNVAMGGPYYPFSYGFAGSGYGGAIANFSSQPVFNICTFSYNSADAGIGIGVEGTGGGGAIYNSLGTVVVDNCIFNNDSANGDPGVGGAIYDYQGIIILDSNMFDTCRAQNYGGTIDENDGTIIMKHNVFDNCRSYSGGVLYASGTNYNVKGNANAFINNRSGSIGGVMSYVAGSVDCTDTLINNVFANNEANKGGAIAVNGYNNFICNNTFFADSALGTGSDGGGIYFQGSTNFDIVINNIFSNNFTYSGGNADTGSAGTGTFYIAYNLYSGMNPGFRDTSNLTGADNIWGTIDDGLELTQCSPAIDAGLNLYVPGNDSADMAQQPRIQNLIVNCGAYETNAPGSINGTATVCVGATNSLSDTTAGGTWSSSNPVIATIDSTGVLTAISQGTAIITYLYNCGIRYTTLAITVQRMSSAIVGFDSLCIGGTIMLTDTTTGGIWRKIDSSVSIDSSTGRVTGISVGTATITYTVSNICGISENTVTVTVDRTVPVISGLDSVCVGSAITLSDSLAGGVWSIDSATIASVGMSGMISGISQGVAVISYTLVNACGTTGVSYHVAVTRPVSAITGASILCADSTTQLVDSAIGGAWTSASTSVANVNTLGIVTGMARGTTVIMYALTNACGSSSAVYSVTVDQPAAPITGTFTICEGDSTFLQDSIPGGNWSSGNSAITTINPLGIASGISSGDATITYNLVNTCGASMSTAILEVENPVVPITGSDTLCIGNVVILSDTSTGGIWQSTNIGIATLTGGIVSGVSPGVDTVNYELTNACGTTVSQFVLIVLSAETCDSLNGVKPIDVGQLISIYPNPTNDVVFVNAPFPVKSVISRLDDTPLLRTLSANSINLSGLPPGLYVLMIYDMENNLLKVEKIILEE